MEHVVNYTEARQKLKSLMDTVVEDRVAVVVTRSKSEPVMMIAKSEFDALMETFHLMRSPRNAERIRAALAEIDDGKVVEARVVDDRIEAQS
ncbi:MAG: type II toxin-antitoxin system prevent-host-death family antitoxin [Gammaproteobacteria bacterium]|nr:type II toxin-antitoxin system prevent-host-death family antitoxin [Gammaproteobacteria bacterium]MYB36807.1 type II toxin-antitoxin system prevent-host-death family antitoxin [Gammaproteobacteria bacterium]